MDVPITRKNIAQYIHQVVILGKAPPDAETVTRAFVRSPNKRHFERTHNLMHGTLDAGVQRRFPKKSRKQKSA